MRRGRGVREVHEVPVRGLRGRYGDGPCERGEVHTKEGNLISMKMERNLCIQFHRVRKMATLWNIYERRIPSVATFPHLCPI